MLDNYFISLPQAKVAVKEKEQFVEFLQKQLEETKDNYQIEVQCDLSEEVYHFRNRKWFLHLRYLLWKHERKGREVVEKQRFVFF